MITVGPYVKPPEPPSAEIKEWKNPCEEQKIACTAAHLDLSDYVIPMNQTAGTANASAVTASGINQSRIVYSIGYPSDLIHIAYNWSELVRQQNETMVTMLNEQNKPEEMPVIYTDPKPVKSVMDTIA